MEGSLPVVLLSSLVRFVYSLPYRKLFQDSGMVGITFWKGATPLYGDAQYSLHRENCMFLKLHLFPIEFAVCVAHAHCRTHKVLQGNHRQGSLRSTYSLRSNYSDYYEVSPLKGGLNTPINRQSSIIRRSMSDMSLSSPRGSMTGAGMLSTPRGISSAASSIADIGNGKQAVPLEPLTKALDALCSAKRPFQGIYMALGPPHRRVGRSGVVQLFDNTETRRRVAIKFYRASACYDRENAMVGKKNVKNISVEHLKVMTAATDGPGGYKWPPCIVMEAGENLSSFMNRAPKRDEATACAVMAEVAALIEALHDTGWAHRNLKPSNVLFVADTETWVFCDLERSARIGVLLALAILRLIS